MINVQNLAALVAVTNFVGDVATVAADPAVRKSASQAARDVRQAAHSITDLCSECNQAWRRVRAPHVGLAGSAA